MSGAGAARPRRRWRCLCESRCGVRGGAVARLAVRGMDPGAAAPGPSPACGAVASSADWERLMEVEPTDEAACRELMRAAIDEGRRHVAIGWYERLRIALVRELGAQPDAETRALYDAAPRGSSRRAGFVGREVELAEPRGAEVRGGWRDGRAAGARPDGHREVGVLPRARSPRARGWLARHHGRVRGVWGALRRDRCRDRAAPGRRARVVGRAA